MKTSSIRHAINKANQKYAISTYIAFHGFGQAKFPKGGSVLGSSQIFNTATAAASNSLY